MKVKISCVSGQTLSIPGIGSVGAEPVDADLDEEVVAALKANPNLKVTVSKKKEAD